MGERRETATARTLRLDVPGLPPALAGQHVDVRLTADDGYTAQRSYSLSSAAGASPVELTVERFADGEVSPYLVDDLTPGDAIEVRGPVGGWLVWRPEDGPAPVQLIAGGSGIAPLMAIARTWAAGGSTAPLRLLYGVAEPERVYYAAELGGLGRGGLALDVRYSRRVPAGGRMPSRITPAVVAEATVPASDGPVVYVCGPTGFVESIADALTTLGHPADRIRTERFGPTG